MKRQSTARGGVLVLAAATAGGCNLIFGITAGEPSPTTSSSGSSTSSSGSTSSSSSGAGGAGGAPSFTVTPDTTTLLSQTTLTFHTTVPAATWKVVEAGGGAVTPAGAYTAPLVEGVYHLEADGAAGAQAQATVTVKRARADVTLVSTGALDTATGHGTQSHVVYAEGAGQWWLFHDPAGSAELATAHSGDFLTWSAGASLTLPQGHSADGRDLAVAYRALNGHDVVHVTQGSGSAPGLGRYHVRATLGAAQVAFGQPQTINTGGAGSPDGSATVILPTGLVIDSTGYEPTPTTPPLSPCGYGDVDVYTSAVVDDGTTSFDSVAFGEQVLWCVGNKVEARQLLAAFDTAVQLFADGDHNPPINVLMNVRSSSNGAWTPYEPPGGSAVTPPSVFQSGMDLGLNEWTAAVAGGKVHAVRRVGGGFEHRVMATMGTWTDGGAIFAEATLPDGGLFLAPYGDGLVLVALSDDGGARVRYAAFDGATWSTWATLTDAPAGRSYLGGYAPGGGQKPAVIWTQTAGTSFAIAGFQLP
jgi:hypothetical protein